MISIRKIIHDRLIKDKDIFLYKWFTGDKNTCVNISGEQLLHSAYAIAYDIKEALPRGGVVAISTSSGPIFLRALLGCIFAGVTILPLPAPIHGPSTRRVKLGIDTVKPNLILTEKSFLFNFSTALEITTSKRNQIEFGPDIETIFLQLTSGTTASPKVVKLSNEAIVTNSMLVKKAWKLSKKDVSMVWLPHHHDMGLFGGIIFPLLLGMNFSQMDAFSFVKSPLSWLQALEASEATITGCSSFAIEHCINKVSDSALLKIDLSKIKAFGCGSEPVTAELLKKFSSKMKLAKLSDNTVFNTYGLAEATLFVAGGPGKYKGDYCSIFYNKYQKVSIFDKKNNIVLEDGREGEICISGMSLFSGYLDNEPEGFFDLDERKWLRTGDLGKIEKKQLKITGRIKDHIIVNGVNISPLEIGELIYDQEPDLNFRAVAAIFNDSKLGRKLNLIIEKKNKSDNPQSLEQIKRIKRSIKGNFGININQLYIVQPGVLERTTSGKVITHNAMERLQKHII